MDKSFSSYVAYLSQIEDDLGASWPENPNSSWLKSITGSLGSTETGDLKAITGCVWELMNRGGKRWRPLVMLLTCEACGGDWREASHLSGLVELPHNGSLIVDDIEDGSEQRRGKPAVHRIYGIDHAINSANFAYFAPTILIDESPYSNELKNRLYATWAWGMRSVHMGQALDIIWHNQRDRLPSVDEYMTMCRLKTGSLSAMASRLGAAISMTDPHVEEELGRIWREVGLGFQMLDDVANLTKGNPGKKRGDDIIEGKKSLPFLLFSQQNPEHKGELLQLFKEARSPESSVADSAIEKAIAMLGNAGVLDEAKNMAHQQLNNCQSRLDNYLAASEARTLLHQLIDLFIEKMD